MVLYIDFEWETEPLKMALSKNFTLPEKCKNRRRAPRVDSRIDQTVFDSKLFGSSLISQRDWRGGRLLARKKGENFSCFSAVVGFFFVKLPLPPPPVPEARRRANSCRWTFKFTLNEEQTKNKKEKKTFGHKGRTKTNKKRKKRRRRRRKKEKKINAENKVRKNTLCLFWSPKRKTKETICFSVKIAVSLSFSLSLPPSKVVFHYINAAVTSYSHWFVCHTHNPPHPDPSCR